MKEIEELQGLLSDSLSIVRKCASKRTKKSEKQYGLWLSKQKEIGEPIVNRLDKEQKKRFKSIFSMVENLYGETNSQAESIEDSDFGKLKYDRANIHWKTKKKINK